MLQCEDLACKFFKIFEIYFSLIFLLILILIIFSVFLYCKIKKYPKIFKQNLANNFAFGLKGDYAEFYSTMQSFYNPFLIFYSFGKKFNQIFNQIFYYNKVLHTRDKSFIKILNGFRFVLRITSLLVLVLVLIILIGLLILIKEVLF